MTAISSACFGRRFNASGTAQGSEFRVNTYTTNHQHDANVAIDADGDFVVAWRSDQHTQGSGIYAQRYNASGVAQGSEFRVHTQPSAGQDRPVVAMDADGDFVVVYSSVQDGSSRGVYAQQYNASGVAQGGEFQVNTFTTNEQRGSVVAIDTDGDFVVSWSSLGQDGDLHGVFAQRYLNNSIPTTSGLANLNVSEDAANSVINLWPAFADVEDADSALTYTVQLNTNTSLFTSTNINPANGQLALDYAPNAFGTAMINVRATDTAGEWVEATFTVNVTGVIDTPSVTNATTYQGHQSTSGLVISRNVADGAEVTHFRITSISGGTLYMNDGTTAIVSGSFITAADGSAGLKFTPSSSTDGSFQVQAATGATVGQLGGSLVTATIDVIPNTPPTTSGIPSVNAAEDAADILVDLWAGFADAEQADNQLTYSVENNTNPGLFTSTAIDALNGDLVLDFAPDAFGTAEIICSRERSCGRMGRNDLYGERRRRGRYAECDECHHNREPADDLRPDCLAKCR